MVLRITLACVLAFAAAVAAAGTFKPYPGAQVDEHATAASNMRRTTGGGPAGKATIYATIDDFDKVLSFYRKQGRVFALPPGLGKAMRLPEGKTLRQTYILLDRAKTLEKSKRWIKIQSPYVGPLWKSELKPGDAPVKELTAILHYETQ